MRFIAKTDKQQAEIVFALRAVGCKVYPTHRLGGGFPDLFTLYKDQPLLLEIKSKGGRMTPEEQDFYNQYQACTVVVYSVDEALRAIGAI
jgi:hypothetical protein